MPSTTAATTSSVGVRQKESCGLGAPGDSCSVPAHVLEVSRVPSSGQVVQFTTSRIRRLRFVSAVGRTARREEAIDLLPGFDLVVGDGDHHERELALGSARKLDFPARPRPASPTRSPSACCGAGRRPQLPWLGRPHRVVGRHLLGRRAGIHVSGCGPRRCSTSGFIHAVVGVALCKLGETFTMSFFLFYLYLPGGHMHGGGCFPPAIALVTAGASPHALLIIIPVHRTPPSARAELAKSSL